MPQPDIFDRIMSIKAFDKIRPFYRKNKEALLYLFFGGLATVLSIALFALFCLFTNELVANVLSWIITVLFAFWTNRTWVFTGEKTGTVWQQMVSFYAGRLATLGAEELLLWIFITMLHLPPMAVKVAAQIVVIVLNYVISKLWIFKEK